MKMKFVFDQTKALTEIIDDLLTHPIAQIFSIPVDPELDEVPDYLEKVKNPMDLNTVRQKIVDGKYNGSIDDFKNDVNQIWENAEIYHGRPSLEVFMADRLKKIFTRKLEAVETKAHEDWSNEYTKCQMALCHLFKAQPAPYLSQFNLTADMEILVPERRMARSWLSAEDTQAFAHMFKFVDDPATIWKIIKILSENEQGIDFSEDDIKINLSALSQRTLRLLKGFATEITPQRVSSSSPAKP
ncbi:Bromodomain containing protein [Tritrichomonas foetus]|uniref:Bromodomain containing protein n=1 Tax=Tritrichomonas foetus TaxID=1144522 RepID=A0A1J4JXM2_9EUKA|nr:Bromodomain containing protein [Tritrichomonas foetus]|eukprot:OHT03739.1 Bromodomain containing protein [Tritrichomonas foetus]